MHEEKPAFTIAHEICDFFEDFIEENGLAIINDERNQDPNAAILYGTQYGHLVDLINDRIFHKIKETTTPIRNGIIALLNSGPWKKDLFDYLDALYLQYDLAAQQWCNATDVANDCIQFLQELFVGSSGPVLTATQKAVMQEKLILILKDKIGQEFKDYLQGVIDFTERDRDDVSFTLLSAYFGASQFAMEEIEERFDPSRVPDPGNASSQNTKAAACVSYRCTFCNCLLCNDEEVLWGHLQLDHGEKFAEMQNWETPYMVESVYDDEHILGIPGKVLQKYNSLMQAAKADYAAHNIGRYETVESWTIPFDFGFEMDLKVCSGDTDDPLWCEAVLFCNGSECGCTDVHNELRGVWEIEHNNRKYVLHVIEE